jgi:secondary thiamine-phosphate synthase enzyme
MYYFNLNNFYEYNGVVQMKTKREILKIATSSRLEFNDITRQIEAVLNKTGIKEGLLNIYSPHSTSALIVNENESGLISDFQETLKKLVPQAAGYQHDRIDNNADSHIRGFLLGCTQTIPVEEGSMMLGTWQSIFFVELDGPRQRKLTITVIGD